VASKDGVLSIEAVGSSDVAAQAPMRTDALFWIASQTKPITATLVMMLVDEGKISLDDPVEKYLPEFAGQQVLLPDGTTKAPVHPITIRNILSHTSGLPFASPEETPTLDGLPLAEAVRTYASHPLIFYPKSQYQYSNAGINTAARVLEVVTGMAYEDFLQTRLLDPLGMKDTTFWQTDERAARIAKSYAPNEAGDGLKEITVGQLLYPLSDRAHRYPMPAGGLFSTATDVVRFCQTVLNHGELGGRRYLSEGAVREMTSRQTPAALADSYGLGWAVGEGWCGHGGAYATNMTIDWQRGLITVFMVQHAGFPGEGAKAQDAFRQAAMARFGDGAAPPQ